MIDECVRQIEQAIAKLPLTACPGLLGNLARLTAQVQMRMTGPHAQTEEPEEKLLNIEGIAKYLQVPVYTARQLANTKGFPMIKIGKHIRAELGALQIWARKHLNKEVDSDIYKLYNSNSYEGPNAQTDTEGDEGHASSPGENARSHRQHGCPVGAE